MIPQFTSKCQYLFLLLLFSCSFFIDDSIEVRKETTPKSYWFSAEQRSAPFDYSDISNFHPFFDHAPSINFEKKTLKYFIENNSDSETQLKLDLATGKYYAKRPYCSMMDIWERYDSSIFKPNFISGIIPRSLDQRGNPLEIIVFRSLPYRNFHYGIKLHEARVVGGIIEQKCLKFPCLGGDGWHGRMLLMAVDNKDENFSDVENLNQLKEKIDWDYTLAFLENRYGVKRKSGKEYPLIRIIGNIKADFALRFSMQYSKIFEVEEIMEMKRNCLRLYQHVWKKIGYSIFSLKNKLINNYDKKILGVTEEIKKSKVRKEILTRIKNFHSRFASEMITCTQYVAASDISENPDKHWFFAHWSLFYNLYSLNFRFTCNLQDWVKVNILNLEKVQKVSKGELSSCKANEYDESMVKASMLNRREKNNNRPFFNYITYDSTPFGTHKKLFNWVLDENLKLHCNEEVKLYRRSTLDNKWPKVLSSKGNTFNTVIR